MIGAGPPAQASPRALALRVLVTAWLTFGLGYVAIDLLGFAPTLALFAIAGALGALASAPLAPAIEALLGADDTKPPSARV